MDSPVSAFGVVHLAKAAGERDDPAMHAPVSHTPTPVDTATIRAKLRASLRPLAREARKAR